MRHLRVGYCTNVHPGLTLAEIREQLLRHAVPVREAVAPGGVLGLGLWLPEEVVGELADAGEAARFLDWLQAHDLDAFTINGFPQGDFHSTEVKHRVYTPDWADDRRRDYTMDLARVLAAWRPEGSSGSISTLPVGWPSGAGDEDRLQASADNLLSLIAFLSRLEAETGRLIHVDLEPEPGCLLQVSSDVVRFFARLDESGDPEQTRRYLRVCHDICHAAVMFESQEEVIAAYDAANILVGKVQVSSAVHVPLDECAGEDREGLIEQLSRFNEDRYLHQAVREGRDGGQPVLYEDLPLAVDAMKAGEGVDSPWRVHFHLPIYIDRFDRLRSTRGSIAACFRALAGRPEVEHYEIETYAWSVLPRELGVDDLSDGIAREYTWCMNELVGASSP